MKYSDCCGAEAYSNGDSCTSDYGICPECKDHCDYVEFCDDCGAEVKSHPHKHTEAYLKSIELLSEFSKEKCLDICDTLCDVADTIGNFPEYLFYSEVKEYIENAD